MAGIGQTNLSAGGPRRSTAALPRMSSAMPHINSTRKNGKHQPVDERPKSVAARTTITTSPTELVAILESTRPLRYSEMESSVAKIFRKFRDHTSSKNAIVTPCITRVRKSHRRTAPSRDETKLKP